MSRYFFRLFSVVLTAGPILTACGVPTATDTESTDASLPDPLAAGWRGRPVCERLHDDRAHRVLRCTFPPGVGHERHFHAPHFGYAISAATMQITDAAGTRTISIAAGESWTSPGVGWHEVLNVGDTTGVYLVVEPRNPP